VSAAGNNLKTAIFISACSSSPLCLFYSALNPLPNTRCIAFADHSSHLKESRLRSLGGCTICWNTATVLKDSPSVLPSTQGHHFSALLARGTDLLDLLNYLEVLMEFSSYSNTSSLQATKSFEISRRHLTLSTGGLAGKLNSQQFLSTLRQRALSDNFQGLQSCELTNASRCRTRKTRMFVQKDSATLPKEERSVA